MNKIDLHSLLILFFIVFSLDSLAGQHSLTLTVLVDGAKANTGQAIGSLFSSANSYLKEPIYKQVMPINGEGSVRFIFSDVAAGTYAVSIVYDEDGNGKLKTGFFGIPSELVGFSNNAKGTFGPPSFKKTSFSLPKSKTISINLSQAKE